MTLTKVTNMHSMVSYHHLNYHDNYHRIIARNIILCFIAHNNNNNNNYALGVCGNGRLVISGEHELR